MIFQDFFPELSPLKYTPFPEKLGTRHAVQMTTWVGGGGGAGTFSYIIFLFNFLYYFMIIVIIINQ